MSQKDKLLEKIRNNPTNVDFETIQNIMLSHDFTETKPSSGSSHYTYQNGIYRITIPRHIPVNKIYIKKAIEIIDKLEAEKET